MDVNIQFKKKFFVVFLQLRVTFSLIPCLLNRCLEQKNKGRVRIIITNNDFTKNVRIAFVLHKKKKTFNDLTFPKNTTQF